MKKLFKTLVSLTCAVLICFSTLAGCGGGRGKTGAGGRKIYPGGNGMFDNKLTMYRWDFTGLDAGRKSNTEMYKTLKNQSNMTLLGATAASGDWKTKLKRNPSYRQRIPQIQSSCL